MELRAEEPRPAASRVPAPTAHRPAVAGGIEQQGEHRVALQRPVVAGAPERRALLILPAARGLAQQIAVSREAERRQDRRRRIGIRIGNVIGGRIGELGNDRDDRAHAAPIANRRGGDRGRPRQRLAGETPRRGRAVALDHDVAPGGDGAAVGQPGHGEELRVAGADRVEQGLRGGVDAPTAAVVHQQVSPRGDDRLPAREGNRRKVRALIAGRKRHRVPTFAEVEQDAALADGVTAEGIGGVEGDVHQVAFEADRDARVLGPETVGCVPLPHRPEVADGVGARGHGPGDAAQRRPVDAAAGREQELAAPAAAGLVAQHRSVDADGQGAGANRPRRGPGRGRDVGEGGAHRDRPGIEAGGRSLCRDLHRPLDPAAVGVRERCAGAEVAAAAGHSRERPVLEAQVGATVAVLGTPGVERIRDHPGAEAVSRPGEAAVAALARELGAEGRAAGSGVAP